MKIEQPGAHLDQMLRQTRASLIQLSSMADSKANMLLTASSVVISLCLPRLQNSSYQIPMMILLGGSLITAVLAAWCNYPRLPPGVRASLDDARKPSFNILFFGDFSRMEYGDFKAAMGDAFDDRNVAYEIMLREVYALGAFLAKRKYKAVRWCYTSFLSGIILSGCTALAQALGVLPH